jgi:integrase
MATRSRTIPGIRARHSRGCVSRSGGNCNCHPVYEAWVWSPRDGKKIRRTFKNLSEAKGWRADATVGLRKRTLRAPSATTLNEAAVAWLDGAKNGIVRTRSGDKYKPSAIRSYESSLKRRLLPDFGGARLADIQRVDLQDLADRLLAQGLDASTIRNTLMPLRAIFRRAVARGEIGTNPTRELELPAVHGKRDRIASPDEAAKLLAGLLEGDRTLWAVAFYGGLRLGELRALRWEDVDLPAGVIRVERAWDQQEGIIATKSRAGRRTVPIASVLRAFLVEHKLKSGKADGFVFGRTSEQPFNPSSVWLRADTAWKNAKLAPIGLHEARHTFASFMIAAGVNAKALATYMGHSSVTTTFDRYGHLMPGNESEAAALLDAYLTGAHTGAQTAETA